MVPSSLGDPGSGDDRDRRAVAGDVDAADASLGRRIFGTDPEGYAAGRPGYPSELFDHLVGVCGLGPGTATVEIGPGAGQATAGLLERGAQPLVLVEPDAALAGLLGRRFGRHVEIRAEAFEDCQLPEAGFDLAACATAFHWLDEPTSLAKLGRILRPGGWWSMWWTSFHVPGETDALYDALTPILAPILPPRPSGEGRAVDFSHDREGRTAALEASGAFVGPSVETFRWTLLLDAARARALFGTFSPILALQPNHREQVLHQIGQVLDEQFAGSFERTCETIVYTAQRR